jgi:uncharacterized membrane protein YkoI
MTSTYSIRSTILAIAAGMAALAASAPFALATPSPDARRATVDPQQAMLTIPQAMTIAEVTQAGAAYSLKRETAGTDIVYHVKVSTPDRGVVNLHVKAYGGQVALQPAHRD